MLHYLYTRVAKVLLFSWSLYLAPPYLRYVTCMYMFRFDLDFRDKDYKEVYRFMFDLTLQDLKQIRDNVDYSQKLHESSGSLTSNLKDEIVQNLIVAQVLQVKY